MKDVSAAKAKCGEMLSRGEPVSRVVAQLRENGLSKVQSIQVLVEAAGCGLQQAKELVHLSEAWADLRNRDDDFHERLSENSEAVSEDPYPAESRERAVAFVRQLAALSPGLASLLDEHMKDFDEILPHLSFGDLTRYVVSLLLAASGRGGLPNRRELRQILDRLEEAFSSGDDELQELIAVSFLENLPHKGEPGAKIRTMLGPRLAKELRAMESWRPRPPAAT